MYSWVIIVSTLSIFIKLNNGQENAYEYQWIHSMGNPSNTRRIIPSLPTNYTGKLWYFISNGSSQANAIQGLGAGINGDLYFFMSENLTHSADYFICMTLNGLIRWRIYLQPIEKMINVGVSNIVSTTDGLIYFISSWTDGISSSGKACRISNGQTNKPILECAENNQLYYPYEEAPLSLDDSAVYLFTTVVNQSIAVINATSLEIVWIDRGVIGCSSKSTYNSDGTGIYWIGDDDHFRKVNGRDTRLLDIYVNSGGNRFYSFDQRHSVIARVWQNFHSTTSNGSVIVSGWDALASGDFGLLWQWNEPHQSSAQSTQPTVNDQLGVTYISVLPFMYAIDQHGLTLWKTQIVSRDEINQYNLISNCLAFNAETNIIHVLVSSSSIGQGKRLSTIFIARLRVNNGQLLNRINIDLPSNAKVNAHCPILIGNEALYIPWIMGNDPDLASLNIMGFPQMNS
ncbi:unnamed protein product [Rotaria socialis]|uniref:Uncharacterized protein n=1 Tax=Rotaria socialis TaxID=392032 RepID=A0A818HUS8_9BILA|nr:unnamed protein product [Rotaria socialis]CAF4562743.1 unnamed protein product [Rotaria socialis]